MANEGQMLLAQATKLLDEVWDLQEIVQEGRFGSTAQHIKKVTPWKGGAMHKKLVNMMYSGAIATSSLEADAPNPTKIDLLDLEIQESHLRRLSFSISHSIQAQMETSDPDHAAYNLARELALQANETIGEKRNQMLNSDGSARKALVAARYDSDGTPWNGSHPDALEAFIKIDGGSISNFHQGEIIDIHNGTTASIRVVAQVLDVIHDTYMLGLNVGPGIVVELATDYLTSGTGTGVLNAFTDVADGDVIVNRTETLESTPGAGDGCGYHAAFSSLMDITATPSAYFGITRSAIGRRFMVPYGHDYSTGGTYGANNGTMVNLDIDAHFGPFADVMGMLIPPARAYRKNKDFQLTDALVCQASPSLVNEIVRQAGQGTALFTRAVASDMDSATRAKLVAVAGWNGAVLINPNVPPIVVQPEALAPANTIRMFEPNCWEFIRMGGNAPTMIKTPGGDMWHNRRNTTTGNLTSILDASGFVIEAPLCDQPRLNYVIMGVKSSL